MKWNAFFPLSDHLSSYQPFLKGKTISIDDFKKVSTAGSLLPGHNKDPDYHVSRYMYENSYLQAAKISDSINIIVLQKLNENWSEMLIGCDFLKLSHTQWL